MGKGAARSPEKLSAEELEERRQKRREEQLGTKSDACFPLERRASLTLSPYVKFKAAVPTQNLTHPMTKRFPPKGTRGRESVLEAEEGRCQAERDREEGTSKEGPQVSTKYIKIPQEKPEKRATLQDIYFVLHYIAVRVIGSFEIGLRARSRS